MWLYYPSTGSGVPTFMPTFTGLSDSAGTLPPQAAGVVSGEGKAASLELSVGVPGMALIPPKLVQKILRGGFIDMYELLPETWRAEEPKESCCRSTRPKRGLVTDITLWTECYASLVAVLATKHPDKTPHFMGYLRTIVRASRNFEGTAWATYDAAYRRQAANRQSLDWATIDPTIYNEAFTGRARIIPRCRYCLADTHEARDCSYAPREDYPSAKQPRSAAWGAGPPQRQDRQGSRAVELCELFNSTEGNKCTFKWCRFAHVCGKCRRGPHPAVECGGRSNGPKQRSGSSVGNRPPKVEEPPRRN